MTLTDTTPELELDHTPADHEPDTGDAADDQAPERDIEPGHETEATAEEGRRGAGRSVTKQIAKRAIEKYLELATATDADRRASALVLGTPSRTEPADIAVMVLAAPRANLRLLDRTDAIAEASDPFDAMATVMSLDPTEIRRVWDLLTELAVHTDRWPGNTATAAKAIARAVHSHPGDVTDGTARIRTLVRK